MTDDKREEWYVEPTLTHELGSLVMEGNRPIAICPRESEALRVVADHNARTQLEERVRELEAALGEMLDHLHNPFPDGTPKDGYTMKGHGIAYAAAVRRARALLSPQESSGTGGEGK